MKSGENMPKLPTLHDFHSWQVAMVSIMNVGDRNPVGHTGFLHWLVRRLTGRLKPHAPSYTMAIITSSSEVVVRIQ